MSQSIDICKINLDEFSEFLYSMRALERLDIHRIRLVCDIQREPVMVPKIYFQDQKALTSDDGRNSTSLKKNKSSFAKLSLDGQKVIAMYFSLLGDGNTRIPLDENALYDRWKKKWERMLQLYKESHSAEYDEPEDGDIVESSAFMPIIKNGIENILALSSIYTNKLFEVREADEMTGELGEKGGQIIYDERAVAKTFVIRKDGGVNWMYAVRFFDAKCIIERRFKKNSGLFHGGKEPSEGEWKAVQDECQRIQKANAEGKKITLNKEQCQAIVRGRRGDNLIITGGPGTGKTTVITYLLHAMLSEHHEMLSWPIYLAAPSGKAADRMRESVEEAIERIEVTDENRTIIELLKNLQSYTIHRLLHYNPGTNKFLFNDKNPFAKESIFVIDEASMIDISLFASLLKAIPDGARVFILGDKDQLPSVDAGAVLGDLLGITTDYVVQLKESNRFSDKSKIGVLSKRIQAQYKGYESEIPEFATSGEIDFGKDIADKEANKAVPLDKIRTLNVAGNDKAFRKLIEAWAKTFYLKLCDEVNKIEPKDKAFQTAEDKKVYDELWESVGKSRILSAERIGTHGVDKINEIIHKYICSEKSIIPGSHGYFPGQLLMLTRNQGAYKLYNGDSGIVVKGNDERYYLMLKKQDYYFYPLSTFAKDTIESAFAITIHKAQGSGYPHVMMFLPEHDGHPLLCRQILYTGVTRVERESLTIVATKDAFEAACMNVIERDTGIRINLELEPRSFKMPHTDSAQPVNTNDTSAESVHAEPLTHPRSNKLESFTDYYYVLGVSRDAAFEVIRMSYRRLMMMYHPDLNPGDVVFEIRTKNLNKIYDVLSDVAKRREYDEKLDHHELLDADAVLM